MAILVTGGTKGIGLSVAVAFAGRDVDVFLNYNGDEAAAEKAQATVAATGARAHLIRADVGTPEGCARIGAAVRRVTPRLDQVVHCAVDAYAAPVLSAEPTRFARAVGTNSVSLMFLVQSVLDLIDRGSSIFFLTSRGGRVVIPNYAAIGVGKAASESLVRYLAAELAPRGIRINCIGPSIVETDAVHEIFGDETRTLMDHAANANPSGRAVRPEDYTSLMRFLASPAAEFITGQVLFVNGGANLSA